MSHQEMGGDGIDQARRFRDQPPVVGEGKEFGH